MTIEEFEKELKLINKDLAIRPNNPPAKVLEAFPDTAKLACITLRGSELATIPNGEIYDEPSGSYGVDLRNDGRFIRHRTRPEALSMVKQTLERLKNDKEYYNDFFGLEESSTESLNTSNENTGDLMLVEEVVGTPIEVKGGEVHEKE